MESSQNVNPRMLREKSSLRMLLRWMTVRHVPGAASSRQWVVVIDDRKGQRFAVELGVPVITTSAIMEHWGRENTPAEIAAALRKIEARADFRPAEDDPNYEWWMRSR